MFCSARAIGWLTAAAQRTNQSAAAEESSAIRGTAQESFNREQREGAERSRQPFPETGLNGLYGFPLFQRGSYTWFPRLSRTIIKLWFLLLKDWEEGRECTGCKYPVTSWAFFPLPGIHLCLNYRSWHTHIIVFILLMWKKPNVVNKQLCDLADVKLGKQQFKVMCDCWHCKYGLCRIWVTMSKFNSFIILFNCFAYLIM